MALSEEDRREISGIITTTLDRGCVCGISGNTQKQVSHFFGMVEDLGGGDIREGIEIFRKVIEMVARHRRFGEKVGGAVATAVSVSIALGVIGSIWYVVKYGFVEWIRRAAGP